MDELILKPDRERSLQRAHPWVFSGAIAKINGNPLPGDTVLVLDHAGNFLATAAYSPASQIRARVWSRNQQEVIDRSFFERKIRAAFQLREDIGYLPLKENQFSAVRLIHAESDGLPGLVVDRYHNTLSAQFLSAGATFWKETIASILLEQTDCSGIYERSDADVLGMEGLPEINAPLIGEVNPRELIHEHAIAYQVDIASGHKTGFYLDQRDNRADLMMNASGREVLNCFCYTGGFSLAAMRGGASSVTSIDSSESALMLARENVVLNGFESIPQEWIEDNVFTRLRDFRDRRRSFDLIVLDPPKFASNAAQVQRAARAYKDINLLALKLLRPGGLLYSFSCSGGVNPELFQKIVAGADADAASEAVILRQLRQSADHPVSLAFPEGAYLKGLVVRKPD